MTLEILKSSALSFVQHGFVTRKGGASSGVFSGLNCGLGSSDQREIVEINRARIAKAMNVSPENMAFVHQIHSTDVEPVPHSKTDAVKADAMVTATPGILLCILTADCQPVLFSDKTAGVIGAAHAGWKGAIDGVLENTVEAMVSLGATRENITAVIGPSISQRAYEVGAEFFERFLDSDQDNARFFANGSNGKYQFNLPHFGIERLHSAGIQNASWTGHCTYADTSRFYSYRRSVHQKEADYGRLASVIRL
ncbi:MAG: peptidoglycan editing factor PgeF [Pseudoruegeria sp.]